MSIYFKQSYQSFLFVVFLMVSSTLFTSCEMLGDGLVVPEVMSKDSISDVLPYSVKCFGKVLNNRGADVSSCGFCWSSSKLPDINDSKAQGSLTSDGNFSGTIPNLTTKVAYLVRAYAVTKKGVGYGKPIEVVTPPLATITTNAVDSITEVSAICGGDITYDYSLPIFERGVCWSSQTLPTINDAHQIKGINAGKFEVTMTGLQRKTTYYVRAYSRCSLGEEYGDTKIFTTK
jgi:hypothetical protein